jgi:hypothetical protein
MGITAISNTVKLQEMQRARIQLKQTSCLPSNSSSQAADTDPIMRTKNVQGGGGGNEDSESVLQ